MVMKLTYHLHLTQRLRKYRSEIVVPRGRYAALNSCLMRTFRDVLLVLSSQVLWDHKSILRIKMRPAECTGTSESRHFSRRHNSREYRRFLSYRDECLRLRKSGAIPRLMHKSSWCVQSKQARRVNQKSMSWVTKPAVRMRGDYFRWNLVSTCSSAVLNSVMCLFFRPRVYKYHAEGPHGDEIWYGGANILGLSVRNLTHVKVWRLEF